VSPQHPDGEPTATFDLASFERLVRVETKLDNVINSRTAEHGALADDIRDHEHRIRTLERVWFKTAGLAAAISALVSSGAFVAYLRMAGGA
jgi:hypothetical protein